MRLRINMPKYIIDINYTSLTFLSLILFVGLRLFDIISWSWWWIISPIWIPWALLFLAYFIIKIMAYLLIGHNKKYYK